jgi:PBP1b-binding outer membrane lipoprotein LpoB
MELPRTALILLGCLALAGCANCKDVKPAPQPPAETSSEHPAEAFPLMRPRAAPFDDQ